MFQDEVGGNYRESDREKEDYCKTFLPPEHAYSSPRILKKATD
jgi:hypothetical protein